METNSPPTPPVSNKWWLYAAAAIGCTGILIRIWLYQQPVNSDDIVYFTVAAQIHPEAALAQPATIEAPAQRAEVPSPPAAYSALNANSLRLTVIAPPAVFSALFGSSLVAFYASVYAFALLTLAGIFAFAYVMGGARIAAIATLVWATSQAFITVDTRLLPDNIGIACALIGLAAIARAGGIGWNRLPYAPGIRGGLLAFIGGFLLWASFSARASFFVFAALGFFLALLSQRRRYLAPIVVAGGLAGQLVELVFMAIHHRDPLIRWKLLLNYGSQISASGKNTSSVYSGYTFLDLITRYPALLAKNSRAELLIHIVGLAGFMAWARNALSNPTSLAKFACAVAGFGFLAFGIVSVDPVVPIMREKLRYYVTVAPFFHLAFAEIIVLAVFGDLSGRFSAAWINRPARRYVAAGAASVVMLSSLWAISQSPKLAKNGNDALLTATRHLIEDTEASNRQKALVTDTRTSRLTTLLLPGEEWHMRPSFDALGPVPELTAGTYLLVNWVRLNQNIYYSYMASARAHNYYRMIENHSLAIRVQRNHDMVDVFYIDSQPIERNISTLDSHFPTAWRMKIARRRTQPLVLGEGSLIPSNLVYSGSGNLTTKRAGSALPGERFLQILFEAATPAGTRRPVKVRASLFWWPAGEKRFIRQRLGTVRVDSTPRHYALWTYLPRDVDSHRIVWQAKGVRISDIKIRLLSRHPSDYVANFRQEP